MINDGEIVSNKDHLRPLTWSEYLKPYQSKKQIIEILQLIKRYGHLPTLEIKGKVGIDSKCIQSMGYDDVIELCTNPLNLIISFLPSNASIILNLCGQLPNKTDQDKYLKIQISFDEKYPNIPPSFLVDHRGFNRKQKTLIENALHLYSKENNGSYMIRKVLLWFDNQLESIISLSPTIINTKSSSSDDKVYKISNETRKLCKYYPLNKCKKGDDCPFGHSKIEIFSAIQEKEGKTEDEEQLKKNKKEKKLCKFFQQGTCRYEKKCKYAHDTTNSSKEDANEEKMNENIDTCSEKEIKLDKVNNQQPLNHVQEVDKWTVKQQHCLDVGLKMYSYLQDPVYRWEKIASVVPDMGVKDCINRFKYVRELLLTKKKKLKEHEKLDEIKNQEKEIIKENITIEKNNLILPVEELKIELNPQDNNGTFIRLIDPFLHAMYTLQFSNLSLQYSCLHCPFQFDVSFNMKNGHHRSWCRRCSVLHTIDLRPCLIHMENNIIVCLNSMNCEIMDILNLYSMGICSNCDQLIPIPDHLYPGKRVEATCFECHTRLAFCFKEYQIERMYSLPSFEKSLRKIKKKEVYEGIVPNQPLPNNGTCQHYSKSFRWFRFQCCGKAFPCDICHEMSDCKDASKGILATRMICGKCSKEQIISNKECNDCGYTLKGNKQTSHWEGGKGCRNNLQLNVKDKQKHRGNHKTQSKKQLRVGYLGKVIREEKKQDFK